MTCFAPIYIFSDFSGGQSGTRSFLHFISFHFCFLVEMLQETVMAVGMFVCGGMVMLGTVMGFKIVSYTQQILAMKKMEDLTEPMLDSKL